MRDCDVLIVGAGPAGSACALRLARAGKDALWIDAQAPPRVKVCGGGLTGRARGLLEREFGLADGYESECRRATLSLGTPALEYALEGESPLVSMTMRAELDARLVRLAREAGAVFLAPCALKDLREDPAGVTVRTSDGELRAAYVVAADGASSPTARGAGWPKPPLVAAGLECELPVSAEQHRAFAETARFDFGHPRRGYAWVFPKREHLSLGCLTLERGRSGLRSDVNTYLERLGLPAGAPREEAGALIPLAPRAAHLARGRVLLAGDAAGLVDPVTAEGISHALVSGRLAAEALVEHGDADPSRLCERYQDALEREVLGELRIARRLARLLYDRPDLARMLFARLGGTLARAMGRIIAGERTYADFLGGPGALLRSARGLLGRV